MVTSPSKTFMLSITIFVHSLFDPEVMLPYPPMTPSTLIDFSCSISVLPMTWPSQNNPFIRLSNDRQCDAFPMQQNVKKSILPCPEIQRTEPFIHGGISCTYHVPCIHLKLTTSLKVRDRRRKHSMLGYAGMCTCPH